MIRGDFKISEKPNGPWLCRWCDEANMWKPIFPMTEQQCSYWTLDEKQTQDID